MLFPIFKNTARQGYAALLLGVLLISFGPLLVKSIQAGPAMIGAYRMAIGGGLLSLILSLSPRIDHPTQSLSSVDQKSLYRLMLWGGFFFATDLFMWHQSFFYLGTGIGTLLTSTHAIYLAIYGVFFRKESWSIKLIIGIILAFVGLACVSNFQNLQILRQAKGILLGCLAGVAYSAFIVSLEKTKRLAPHYSSLRRLRFISIVAAIFLYAFAALHQESITWSWKTILLLSLLGGEFMCWDGFS